jgi:predicted RecA/RadA family phage recombinase
MKNYIQDGAVLALLAPYALSSGDGFQVGSIFAVASCDAANGAAVEGSTEGVFDLAKTSAQAWTVGQKIYWNNSTKKCDTDGTVGILIGAATAIAANPSSTGYVKLNEAVAALSEGPEAAVASLTENAGALGGTNDGDLPDLTATAAALTGTLTGTTNGALVDVAATAGSTAGGATPTAANVDAGIATAVASIVLGVNEQNKEFLVMINKLVADNVALRAAVREVAAKENATLSALRLNGVILA